MRLRQILLDGAWCLLLAFYTLMGVQQVPLHGDESTLIFMGRDFYYHIQGEHQRITLSDWGTLDGDAAAEQQLRLINGTLPKYLYGMTAYFGGYKLDDLNNQWAWGMGWEWNHENGHVPTDDLLYQSRYVSAIFLAISAIALYGIGTQISGRIVGVIASAYYVLNPAVLINGRRAMMEGNMLAFTLLAVLVALGALKHRHWGWFIVLGILSGLAVASKHTSVVTIAAIFAASGLHILINEKAQRQGLLRLIGAGLLSLVVFYGMTPAWWGNPVGALSTMLDIRQDLLSRQVEFFGGYDTLGAQVTGFVQQSFIVEPMYAETEVDGFIENQTDRILRYEDSLFSGISIGGTVVGGMMVALLVIVGSVGIWQSSEIDGAVKWVIVIWSIAMVVLTLGLTPLEWQRYYLPIYPIIGLLAAIGIQTSFTTLTSWQKQAHTN